MQSAETVLDVYRERGRRGLPVERVYRQLYNPQLFLIAYANLYGNAGAMTPGTTEETVDAMSMTKIENTIAQLRKERYRWKPVRRANVPKKNGQIRPLGIPTWSDKLVQEVIRLLLEAYYEPQFSDHSHGFRPRRGCHTALLEATRNGKGTKWFIEGDIEGCFDNIDHEVLLSILREKIHDNRFLRLIENLLKAGYCEWWRYWPSYSGTPQGGVISPLLANIYLDQLDQFAEQTLLPAYKRGEQRRRNPEWNKATCRVYRYRKQGQYEEARKWDKIRHSIPSCDTNDPGFRRLHYVRYADDFLLCFAGPKREAEGIKNQLKHFLSETLKLELSEEKTLITHATTRRARFLGYEIYSQHCDTWRDRRKVRTVNGVLALRIPRDVIDTACARYMKRGKPTHRPEMAGDSDYDIVRQFQWHYAGLVNYYLLAHNIGAMSKLRWIMESSLLRTLANKHKTSVGKLWRKHKDKVQTPYGPRRCVTATHPRPGKEPLVARFGGIPLRRQKDAVLRDRVPIRRPRRTELIKRLLADQCEVCGSTEQVEVHHVRKLADIKKKGRRELPDWAKIMIVRRRKTLVVCHACHTAIHAGKPLRQKHSQGITGEPDDGKLSRPVRWGAVEKGAARPPRQPPTRHSK
jgi:group II intron reverse transcriptase/maturase